MVTRDHRRSADQLCHHLCRTLHIREHLLAEDILGLSDHLIHFVLFTDLDHLRAIKSTRYSNQKVFFSRFSPINVHALSLVIFSNVDLPVIFKTKMPRFTAQVFIKAQFFQGFLRIFNHCWVTTQIKETLTRIQIQPSYFKQFTI